MTQLLEPVSRYLLLCVHRGLICILCLTSALIYSDSPMSLWRRTETLCVVTKDEKRQRNWR